MKNPQVNVRIEPSVIAEIDAVALERGVTRSEVIRNAVTVALNAHTSSGCVRCDQVERERDQALLRAISGGL